MSPFEKIKIEFSKIWIDEDGILRLKINDGAELDLKEITSCFAVYEKLGCRNKKALQLIDGRNYFSMDEDAQKYSAKYGKDFFIASALVNDSLSVRLLFNFFNTFNKHDVPFKVFGTEKEALKWLRKFKRK